nr:MAG TPA: hypothetical protein [Caudoviricetes sp.]
MVSDRKKRDIVAFEISSKRVEKILKGIPRACNLRERKLTKMRLKYHHLETLNRDQDI